MSDYIVEVVNENNKNTWRDFCAKSRQVTPFMYDNYLEAVGFKSDNFFVSKKESIIAGLCLPISIKSGKMASPVPFAPYQGLLYRSEKNIKSYNFYKENLEATEVLLEYVGERYQNLSFSNHYTIKDIRGISWYNYHDPEKGMYDINISYTAIREILIDREIEFDLSQRRKRDYKYSQTRHRLRCVENIDKDDIEDFMSLYCLTFERQDISLDDEVVGQVRNIICTALKKQYGFLRYAETEDGTRIGAVFILYDKNCAYYLFGANHPEYRAYGGGTFLMVESMKIAQKMGVYYFDFVGANSPLRGDFKLSFGAELIPYYQANFNRS